MHIKITKTENAKATPQPLTTDTITSAVAAYLANGGGVTICPTTTAKR